MKINFHPPKILLWVVTWVMVFSVCFFAIFFISGLLMAVFQVKDFVIMKIHVFISLPISIICSVCWIAKRRSLISEFIDANVGR